MTATPLEEQRQSLIEHALTNKKVAEGLAAFGAASTLVPAPSVPAIVPVRYSTSTPS